MADVVALAIGLTTTATVRFVGDLPISEIILVAFLPIVLVVHRRRVLRREYKVLFSLLGFWLLGQAVSDIYRHTATLDWIRGDAAIIFFGLDLLGLIVLLRKNERRKIIFLAGTAIGSILVTVIHPSDYALDQPWKFGYASGVITIVMLMSSFFYARRMYMIAGLLVLGIAGVNLLENFRGPVGQLLVVIALFFPVVPEQFGRLRILPRSGGAVRVAVLLVLSLGAAWGAERLVIFATSAGLVSEEARAKNEAELNGGFLLGGRPEIQVSSKAVMDSPIIGHGSWAADPKYVKMLFDIEVEGGVLDASDREELSTGLIPAHSHLMGAWVWAGILGAAFWFYILWLTAKATIRLAILRPPSAPIYGWFIVGTLWTIMFSPFGLNARMYDAVAIVITFDLLEAEPVHIKNMLASMRRRIMFNRPRRLPNPRLFPTTR
ncbi:MAG: hypothetical protein WCA10_17120 [Terracidiphilus sp.]